MFFQKENIKNINHITIFLESNVAFQLFIKKI